MTSQLKTFLVTFTETTGWRVKVHATDEDDALQQAENLFSDIGPEPSQGFDFDHSLGGTDDWEATEIGPADRHPLPTRPMPVLRTANAYTYSPEHRCGEGWVLANDEPGCAYLTIQRVDCAAAFSDDHEAAFHVVCAATFDAGAEGESCRAALSKIIRFGERGINPIATMRPALRAPAMESSST